MVAVGARQETIMKLDADSTKAARTIGQAAGPWNRGKLIGQKLPLKLREVWWLWRKYF